jgi:UDP-N-acetylmuramoyl-tripeptide--D-alanyl-D-alanine ligase
MDSRLIEKGEIFIAFSGERTDGHNFLEEARRKGALLAVVTHRVESSDLPQLHVPDPLLALREMGRLALNAHREADHRIVALTGSVGKTTTKELIRLGLSGIAKTHATHANENNEIGVPLTLLSWAPDAPFCVLEAGVRKVSDIDYLAPLLRSDVGIITAIAEGHLEHLQKISDVWAEKSKILRCVVPGGSIIVPEPVQTLFPDDPIFRTETLKVVIASLQTGEGMASGAGSGCILPAPSGLSLRIPDPKSRKNIVVALSRPSFALAWCSLLAVLAVGALGEDMEGAAARISSYDGLPGRMERRLHPSGLLLLLDHYNANPASMKEALSWLGRELTFRPGSRGFAVLGDMLELGADRGIYHERAGEQAARVPIETIWYRGEERPAFEKGFVRGGGNPRQIRPADSFGSDLSQERGPSERDVLLVKGSRGMKLEDVVAPLIGRK